MKPHTNTIFILYIIHFLHIPIYIIFINICVMCYVWHHSFIQKYLKLHFVCMIKEPCVTQYSHATKYSHQCSSLIFGINFCLGTWGPILYIINLKISNFKSIISADHNLLSCHIICHILLAHAMIYKHASYNFCKNYYNRECQKALQ